MHCLLPQCPTPSLSLQPRRAEFVTEYTRLILSAANKSAEGIVDASRKVGFLNGTYSPFGSLGR